MELIDYSTGTAILYHLAKEKRKSESRRQRIIAGKQIQKVAVDNKFSSVALNILILPKG